MFDSVIAGFNFDQSHVFFELWWVIVCVPCMNDYLPLRALWCFSRTVLMIPNVKRWIKLFVPKGRERLTFGEKMKLLRPLVRGENAVPVWAAITGSMIVGRTFPIVLLLIRKPSLSFKLSFPSNLIPKRSFSNSVYESYYRNIQFPTPGFEHAFSWAAHETNWGKAFYNGAGF